MFGFQLVLWVSLSRPAFDCKTQNRIQNRGCTQVLTALRCRPESDKVGRDSPFKRNISKFKHSPGNYKGSRALAFSEIRKTRMVGHSAPPEATCKFFWPQGARTKSDAELSSKTSTCRRGTMCTIQVQSRDVQRGPLRVALNYTRILPKSHTNITLKVKRK